MDEQQLIQEYMAAKAAGDEAKMDMLARQLASSGEATAGDVTRAVGQGLTLGFGDEVEAGVRSIFDDRDYAEIRDEIRSDIDEFRDNNPILANSLEIGGGMLTGGVGGARATAALAGRKLLGGALARNAAVGAGEGAIAGLGTGRGDFGDQLAQTGMGAAGGAIIGGTLGKLFDTNQVNTQGNRVADLMTTRANRTPQQLADEVAELNAGYTAPWATVADIDPGVAKAAVDARPPGGQRFEDLIAGRQERQLPMVQEQLNRTLGTNMSRNEASKALQAQRQAEGRAMYEPLRNELVEPTPGMLAQLDFDRGAESMARKALDATRRQWNNRNLGSGDSLTESDAVNQFDFWHNFQQLMRETGSGATESGRALGGPTGRAILDAREGIMADMFGHDWGSAYHAATQRYRANSELMEALGDSAKFMNMDTDVLRDVVSGLQAPGERSAFAIGVVSDIIEKSMRSPDTANMARNIIKSPGMRERLRIVLGENKADGLIKTLRKLSKMTETNNMLFANSNTATKQAMQKIVGGAQPNPMGAVEAAQRGDLMGAAGQVLGREPMGDMMNQDVAQRTLNLMQANNPAEIMRALAELRKQRPFGVGVGAAGAGTTVMGNEFPITR